MQIDVLKSTGALLAAGGAPYYGQSRPADSISVRSSSQALVRFWDDNGNPTLLDAATGTLAFTAQLAAGDLFTVGTITYKAVSALTGAPDEVLLGTNLAAFIANLVGAVNAATTGGQAAGTTFGAGTAANGLAYAMAGTGTTILFTAWQADASGNTVATTTTSAHASFGGATLSGADILNLDIKPTGEYDANFTLATPTFTAPATAASGYYTGTLTSNTIQGNGLLRPNNPGVGTLLFTGQPAANDTFTIGAVTYKTVAALTGAADEVLIGASLATTIANLIGAINAASTGGQAAGTTYGTGTLPNTLATAAAGNTATSLNLTATAAALGVAVATTTASAAAAFSAAVLTAPISTAVEPPSVPLMAQLSWGPITSSLPERSTPWTVNLTNSIRNGGEGAPEDANQSYTTAQVLTGLERAAAAEPGLGDPAANGYVLISSADGVRSWAPPPSANVDGTAINPASVTASQFTSPNGFSLSVPGGVGDPLTITTNGNLTFQLDYTGSLVTGHSVRATAIGLSASPFGVVEDVSIIRTAAGQMALVAGHADATGAPYGGFTLGNLTASGTISGQRVCRPVSANATAVVSASGSTPADCAFAANSSSGAFAITIPALGLASGQERAFVVHDVGGAAATNNIGVVIIDTLQTFNLATNGGTLLVAVSNPNGTPCVNVTVTAAAPTA